MCSSDLVADNTGARRVACIGVLGRKNRADVEIGDIINVNVKESSPDAAVKKGEVAKAVVVRTKQPIRRPDG